MPDPTQVQTPQTPDLTQALGGEFGPAFSANATAPAPLQVEGSSVDVGDIQKSLVQSLQDLSTKLDPNSQGNQNLAKQLQSLSYTPEMRAQDMYNKAFGISTVPGQPQVTRSGTDQNGLPQVGLTQGEPTTKRNWLQTILGTAREAARGISEKGNYVPPMERYREQAIKEYSAEAIPAVRDLLYETQERRSLMGNVTQQFRILEQTRNDAVKNQISASKANVSNWAQSLIDPARKAQYDARTQQALAETDAVKQATELKKIEEDLKQETGGMTGNAGIANQIEWLKKNGQADKASKIESDYKQFLQIQASGRWKPNLVTGSDGNFYEFDPRSSSLKPVNNGGPNPVQGQGGNQTTPDTQAAVKAYYRGAPSLFSAQFKGQYPPEMTPDEKAIVSTIPLRAKLTGEDDRRSRAAELGYQNAQDLYKIINTIPDNQIGTFVGNMNKFIAGHTSEADPSFVQFMNQSGILGANHSAAQAFRSTEFVKDIQDSLSKFGTNKAAIRAGIGSYEKTFLDTLSDFPELKGRPFARNMDPVEAMRVFHPDLYQSVKDRVYNAAKEKGLVK